MDTWALWVTAEAGAAACRAHPNGRADACPGEDSQRETPALVYGPVVT